MKLSFFYPFFNFNIIFCLFFISPSLLAQVIPDQTLGGESSVVIPNQSIKGIPSELIGGGATRGSNLFHSFQEFHVQSGKGVFFINPSSIDNILVRVTGANPSNILGILGSLGKANLFLINPQGILFGENATLALQGSFLATTGNSLLFANGDEFSAANPRQSVLTNSLPQGINFGNNPGFIQVLGREHTLGFQGFFPTQNVFSTDGLQVLPNHNIALIGGNLQFLGGVLKSNGGHIELGSVSDGFVFFDLSSRDWSFRYDVQNYQDIALTGQSAVTASGLKGGSISVRGHHILVADGSTFFIQTLSGDSGNIKLKSSSLTINGSPPEGIEPLFIQAPSSLFTENLGAGKGGDIQVVTDNLTIEQGGQIITRTFLKGLGGNILLEVSKNLDVLNFNQRDSRVFSAINSATFGQGKGGNISVFAQDLRATSGGNIGSVTFGTGDGGNVEVNVPNSIQLIGATPDIFTASTINAVSTGRGNAGTLILNTSRLFLDNGGRVNTASFAAGNAGNLFINASDFIEIKGQFPGSINPSQIDSSVNLVEPNLQAFFSLPSIPTGLSGNVTINTPNLIIKDRGLISVNNDGIGDAGNLKIQAETISLENQGRISATTQSGQGGNISILAKTISLQNGSQITATAQGIGNGGVIEIFSPTILLENSQIEATTTFGQGGNLNISSQDIRLFNSELSATSQNLGDGGNIRINTNFLFLFNNSRITANAFQGNGGNINISAKGLFVSPDSTITASSQFGLDGQVNLDVNFFATNPADTGLPLTTPSVEPKVSQFCATARKKSRFTIEGRQGIPTSPDNRSSAYDLTDLAPLGEVIGVEKLPDGRVRLLSCNRLRSERNTQEN